MQSHPLLLTMTHFKPRIGVVPLLSAKELQRLTMLTLLVVGAKDLLRNGKRIPSQIERFVPNLKTKNLPEEGHAIIHGFDRVTAFLENQDMRTKDRR